MFDSGLYSRFEIPAKALQAYHCDFYLAQVKNGGHSQFIHNGRAYLKDVLADIRAGLIGMKAEAHGPIFEQMAAWIVENPEEAAKQTGFQGGRAEPLNALDRQLYHADNKTPMIGLSATWIASWPDLRIVDDADYKEALRRTAMMNPLREPRLLARSVANLTRQMTEWFQVGVGLACANGPKVEIKLAIGGGGVMDVEGEPQTAFVVRTNAEAPRFCVVTNRHAAAYERVQNDPPMPQIGDVDGLRQAIADGRLKNYKGPRVGKKLSHVEGETIAGVIALATKYRAPAALDLLLRRANVDPNGASVAPLSVEPKAGGAVVKWLVAAGGRAFFALSNPNGSALFRAEDTAHLASVRSDEAGQHAARAEAGAVKLD